MEISAESQQQALQAMLDKVRTISAKGVALDMRSLELGLPLRLANDLRGACIPLAPLDTQVVETHRLDMFWEQAECHICSLSSRLDLHVMTRKHL